MKIKLHERMIKTKDPFKKLELIRINKARHCNKYFLENKKDLGMEWNGKTSNGIREIISINKKSSKERNCSQVNNKTITDIKSISLH